MPFHRQLRVVNMTEILNCYSVLYLFFPLLRCMKERANVLTCCPPSRLTRAKTLTCSGCSNTLNNKMIKWAIAKLRMITRDVFMHHATEKWRLFETSILHVETRNDLISFSYSQSGEQSQIKWRLEFGNILWR
jgi:hypothetical protein